jgi:hypothetical protein
VRARFVAVEAVTDVGDARCVAFRDHKA